MECSNNIRRNMSVFTSTREDEIDINVKLMGTLKVKKSETIKDLKALLCEKFGIPEKYQTLFFDDRMLTDVQSLGDCGVQQHSTLSLSGVMKIYVQLPSGQDSVMIEAKAQDTIRSIKTMIQVQKKKIHPDQFTLVYDGNLLEDCSSLASLGIKDATTLYMVSVPKEYLSISVKEWSGETVKLTVRALFTVRDIKTLVGSRNGVSVIDQNLIYACKELEDTKTLSFYDIKDGSVLEISPSSFQIFAKTMFWGEKSQKTITIDVKPCDTVEEVKTKVLKKLNLSMININRPLYYMGKPLHKDQDLASYNITKESTLVLY